MDDQKKKERLCVELINEMRERKQITTGDFMNQLEKHSKLWGMVELLFAYRTSFSKLIVCF
jgi:hypothetical protein